MSKDTNILKDCGPNEIKDILPECEHLEELHRYTCDLSEHLCYNGREYFDCACLIASGLCPLKKCFTIAAFCERCGKPVLIAEARSGIEGEPMHGDCALRTYRETHAD